MMPSLKALLTIAFLFHLTCIVNPFPRTHNLTLPHDERHPICTTIPAWTSGRYDPSDCLLALHKLEDTDYKLFRTRDFEFLALGASPKTDLDWIRLPRKYTVGSCTLVIAMLANFLEYSLPGQIQERVDYDPSDVSKFSYLWSVASWVDGACVGAKTPMLGWCATGESYSIGVFFAATRSTFNKEVGVVRLVGNSSRAAGVNLELARLIGVGTSSEDDVAESS